MKTQPLILVESKFTVVLYFIEFFKRNQTLKEAAATY